MKSPIQRRQGAKLPHWTTEGATYSVTFRLADSVPSEAAERLQRELTTLEAASKRGHILSLGDQIQLSRLRSEKIDQLLNAGHGACLLRSPGAAETVAGALQHFDGKRYRLLAWCVMPNHVHVVFKPDAGHELPKLLHSWKSFSANEINKKLKRTGALWQTESYDHLVRDMDDLRHQIDYVRQNPAKAGLTDWLWVWVSTEFA
jgi:REP element-mobilizing transposase RayT